MIKLTSRNLKYLQTMMSAIGTTLSTFNFKLFNTLRIAHTFAQSFCDQAVHIKPRRYRNDFQDQLTAPMWDPAKRLLFRGSLICRRLGYTPENNPWNPQCSFHPDVNLV